MVNLLDGIRKLKARRQEVSQASGVVAEVPDDLAEVIALYSAIGEKSALVRGENSTATDEDKAELERLKKSFSFRWNNLLADKQKELVNLLLERELLSKTVKKIIDMFDGTVISLV